MLKKPRHIFPMAVLALAALILSLDLFIHQGEAATFDSQIHITNIAQYTRALRDGDFPVTWADGFANYGLPTPIVSQQLTNYAGALLTFMTGSPVLSYKILVLLGGFLACAGLYTFLRLFTSAEPALIATLFFNFTAYRIFNLYVRGALPEFFAVAFIPFILVGIYHCFHRRPQGYWLVLFSTVLLILAHPFMFVIGLFLILPFALLLFFTSKTKSLKPLVLLGLTFVAALLVDLWYILPLTLEMKYFVISKNVTQLVAGQFLGISNYFSSSWPYYYQNDIFVRGNVITFGFLESLCLAIGLAFLWFKSPLKQRSWVMFLIGLTLFLVFMTSPYAAFIYQHVPVLADIQFPWRFLGILMFLPPIILALVLAKIPFAKPIGLILLMVVVITRFPELYGKNYTHYEPEHYTKTIKNLHFDSLNTLWIGNTLTYPVKSQKGDIVEGTGQITSRVEKNSWRQYAIQAGTDLRLVDYTFYFPGWRVYVDGQPVTIEFQDPNYRGVITYRVPAGTHTVQVVFERTTIRLLAQLISLFSIISCIGVSAVSGKKQFKALWTT